MGNVLKLCCSDGSYNHKCTRISAVHLGEVCGVYIIGQKQLLVVFVCFLFNLKILLFFYGNMDSCQGEEPGDSSFNSEVKPAFVSTQCRWGARREPFLA